MSDPRHIRIGPVVICAHAFFANEDEADEWLSFDAPDHEREQAYYSSPDRFTEWQRWKRVAEDA